MTYVNTNSQETLAWWLKSLKPLSVESEESCIKVSRRLERDNG
jgi:hypothetical protein